jgi:hypothetical protein
MIECSMCHEHVSSFAHLQMQLRMVAGGVQHMLYPMQNRLMDRSASCAPCTKFRPILQCSTMKEPAFSLT